MQILVDDVSNVGQVRCHARQSVALRASIGTPGRTVILPDRNELPVHLPKRDVPVMNVSHEPTACRSSLDPHPVKTTRSLMNDVLEQHIFNSTGALRTD